MQKTANFGCSSEIKELLELTLNKVTVLEAQVRELRRSNLPKETTPWVNQKGTSDWEKVVQAPVEKPPMPQTVHIPAHSAPKQATSIEKNIPREVTE